MVIPLTHVQYVRSWVIWYNTGQIHTLIMRWSKIIVQSSSATIPSMGWEISCRRHVSVEHLMRSASSFGCAPPGSKGFL